MDSEKRIKAGTNKRKVSIGNMRFIAVSSTIITALSLLVAATPTPEVYFSTITIVTAPYSLYMGRVILSPSKNSNTGSPTPMQMSLSPVNPSATSPIFPSAMH
jgi:hypothetical protein